MALFGKKKDGSDAGTDAPPAEGAPIEQTDFSEEKARKFFTHARTVHDATNYEYAMTLWLNGLRQSPSSMEGVEGYWRSSIAFNSETKGKLSKESRRNFPGKGPVERYLLALLDWGVTQFDPHAATKAVDSAAKLEGENGLDMSEVVYWIAERALPLIARDKKPTKDMYLRVMNACMKIGAYDLAVRAGDAACQLAPQDVDLSNQVRNLAAQATMSTGGYDQTGQQGGFRSNIRNSEKQRLMEDQDRIVKSEDVKDRLVNAAEEEYRKRPDDTPTINALVKALLERGRTEDEVRSFKVLTKAYEDFKQFHFRQKAGEIRLRQARRKLGEYESDAAAHPDDATKQSLARQAKKKYLEMELQEYRLRVENYPTDVQLKYELGKREFALENFDEAIALFQESQNDPRVRAASLRLLGESFHHKGWVDEAIDTFRGAIERHGSDTDEMGRELKYGLMSALQDKARAERHLPSAQEAEKLASSIAIQQINFRDIRERRDALKNLVNELKG